MALSTGCFGVGEALSVGLKRFFPILGTSFLGTIIVMMGLILLIVPGLIAACAFIVVIPVCTIERLDPIGSLRRSRSLTKGSRWTIFAALLIVGPLFTFFDVLMTFAVTKVGGRVAGELASDIAQVLTTAIYGVFLAVVYYELRAQKEGIGIEAFDTCLE